MAIFQQNIPVNPLGTPPNAGTALNTTGFNNTGGIFNSPANGLLSTLLGTNRADSFYKDFYNNLLTTANAPPMNSLWLVFIQDLPAKSFLTKHNIRENSGLNQTWYDKASYESRRPRGIIIAQGVKHVGDGNKFSREGYNNTGLWKGILSNGRNDIEQLQVSFLESNVSFVDYALRPWSVAVAHEGLTNKAVIANNITVWHLSKMGAGANLARRKVIKYHNCFPTSIDSQEYNYSGDDIAVQRQVSFGFSYYTMEDADSALLSLLSYGAQENKFLGFLKDQANQALENLQQQFGANNISQYINNIVERGKSFGTSLVSNTLQGAVSNVAGAVQGAVDGAIRDLTSAGLSAGVNAVNSIADAANEAVDSLVNSNPNSDTVRGGTAQTSSGVERQLQASTDGASNARLSKYGYIEKKINKEDTVTHETLTPIVERRDVVPVDTNRAINEEDVPKFETPGVIDLAEGGITIPRTFSTGGENDDTPIYGTGRQPLFYVEKSINESDTPVFLNAKADSKPTGGIAGAVGETADNAISITENNLKTQIQINTNDSAIGSELVEYVEKEIPQNDSDAGKNPQSNQKSTNTEDAR